jgi:hypothetical protein
MKMRVHWQLWLMLLVVLNLVIPLFFLNRLEAQIVLAAIVASAAFMTILAGVSGFTRLLGLGHIFWFPLLYFLWTRVDQVPADDFFGIWIRLLIVFNSLSLVIDLVDIIRYIAGDREETVTGL